ncbi:unnamed protein product [Ostreobium quekettii]|uniref:C2 domain-containing protein n=1 Tax=Ostreobium quekettii TaxID=121088 RepID=A0A8S1JDE4_9CHLO|nr:unnamed protein product [Ostreobium quekettii]
MERVRQFQMAGLTRWYKSGIVSGDCVQEELAFLEEKLTTAEAAEFRWWAWAQVFTKNKLGYSAEDLHLKALEVQSILGATKNITEKPRSMRDMHLEMKCPKIGLDLLLDSSGDYLSILHMSMRGISLEMQLGDSELKYQSGHGPAQVWSSCSSLEFTHDAISSLRPGTTAGDGWSAESWILQSPPLSSPASSQQNFLDLIFQKYPLQSLQPRSLQLNVAPIDTAFVEELVCKIALFVAEGVSLHGKEFMIMQTLSVRSLVEEALEDTSFQGRAKAQPTPTQELVLKMEVGDVRFLLPCHGYDYLKDSPPRKPRLTKRLSWNSRPSGAQRSPLHFGGHDSDETVLVLVLGGFVISTETHAPARHLSTTIGLEVGYSGQLGQNPQASQDGSAGSSHGSEWSISAENEDSSPFTSPVAKHAGSLIRCNTIQNLETPPGATTLEKVSVQFTLRAFLAELGPACSGISSQQVCVLEPVKLHTTLHHWLEMTATDTYQQVVEVHLLTTTLHAYISPFASGELFHLLASLKRTMKHCLNVSSIDFGGLQKEQPRSVPDRTSTTEKSRKPQVSVSLSWRFHQVIPDARISLARSSYLADDVTERFAQVGYFQLNDIDVLSSVDRTTANITFSLGSVSAAIRKDRCGLNSKKGSMGHFNLLHPVPAAVRMLSQERMLQTRVFRAWRALAKNELKARIADGSLETQPAQIYGQITKTQEDSVVSIVSSFLVLSLDNQVLQQCLGFLKDNMDALHKVEKDSRHTEKTKVKKGDASPVNSFRRRGKSQVADATSEQSDGRMLPQRTSSLQATDTVAATDESPERGTSCKNVSGDFKFGCIRVTFSVDDQPLAVLFAEGVEGELELRISPRSTRLILDVCDLKVIDRLHSCERYKHILDSNIKHTSSYDGGQCHVHVVLVQEPPCLHGKILSCSSGEMTRASSGTAGSHKRGNGICKSDIEAHKECPLDTFVRVKISDIHISLVVRFLKDIMHLVKRLEATAHSPGWTSVAPTTPSVQPPCSEGCLLMEVELLNFRLEIPRCSWSTEFYSICGNKAIVVFPSSEEKVAMMRAKFGINSAMCSSKGEGHLDAATWSNMSVRVAHQQLTCCGPFFTCSNSDCRLADFAEMDEEFYAQFSHNCCQGLDESPVVGIAIEGLEGYWAEEMKQGGFTWRHVVDGANLVGRVLLSPKMMIKVWWPRVRAVFGDLQFNLLMAVLYENANESNSFEPPPPHIVLPGEHLPPAPPPPETLGISVCSTLEWELDIHFAQFSVLAEKESSPDDELPSAFVSGFGDRPVGVKVAQALLQDAGVCIEQFSCGSMRIRVMAMGIRIEDIRPSQVRTGVVVLNVDPPLTRRGDNATIRQFPWASAPRGRLLDMRESMHYRSPYDERQSPGPSNAPQPTSANACKSPRPGTPQMPDTFDHFFSEHGDGGFLLDYVIQTVPPLQECGPHVMDLLLLKAHLCWPYVMDMSWLMDISNIYSGYFWAPTCSPHPLQMAPDNWFYINVVLSKSEVFVPVGPEWRRPRALASRQGGQGLKLSWDSLRVGYYWGGDQETTVRVDSQGLQGSVAGSGAETDRTVVMPFSTFLDVNWHNPKSSQQRRSMILTVWGSKIAAVSGFKQIPLFQSLISLLRQSMTSMEVMSAPDTIEEDTVEPEFRATISKVQVDVDCIQFRLDDDRRGHPIVVLELGLNRVHGSIGWEQLREDQPVVSIASLTSLLEANYLNSGLDSMEAFLESWPFTIEYRDVGAHRAISTSSKSRLNLLLSPSGLRSLGDLVAFVEGMGTAKLAHGPRHAPSHSIVPLLMGSYEIQSCANAALKLYRLKNRSGMCLTYWVEQAGAAAPLDNSTTNFVSVEEEVDLAADPVEKVVSLPGLDAHQQVSARTMSMQFEGNWDPIVDIIVDKVGKYVYDLKSPMDGMILPIVMDVSLQERTKVLTVHSPYRIENRTTIPLEFRMNLMAHQDRHTGLRRCFGAGYRIPRTGHLEPGDFCYLPVPACMGALLYLKAAGYQRAEKDVIRIQGDLNQQQGLYTCPSRGGGHSFHCCMELCNVPVKKLSNDLRNDACRVMEVHEHVLNFHPPLTIHNTLPVRIEATVLDSVAIEHDQKLAIEPSEAVPVYDFDHSHTLKLHVGMGTSLASQSPAIIMPVPVRGLGPIHSQLISSTVPSKDLELAQTADGPLPGGHRLRGTSLRVRLHHKVMGESGARCVTVFSRYWIVNKTGMPLELRDAKTQAYPPVCTPIIAAPVRQSGEASAEESGQEAQTDVPVLFNSKRGAMCVGITVAVWSKPVNLDSVGMMGCIQVLGPPRPCRTASTASDGLDDTSPDADIEPIMPHGHSSKRSFSSRNIMAMAVSDIAARSRRVHASAEWKLLTAMQRTSPRSTPPRSPKSGQGQPSRVLESGAESGAESEAEGWWSAEEEEKMPRLSKEPPRNSLYEFNVAVGIPPSLFHHTKIITLTPRFILINTSGQTLEYGQKTTCMVYSFENGQSASHHWYDSNAPHELCVRPANDCHWSGSFRLDEVNDFGLRIRRKSTREFLILPVDISLRGESLVCNISRQQDVPPYRIENRCAAVTIKFQQRDVFREWETLRPMRCVDYAWDEPSLAHKMRVTVDSDALNVREPNIHEYNLDNIRPHPTIVIHRGIKFRMAQMGRNLLQNRHSGDAPDSDVVYVHVCVLAEGPTRILRFSDQADQYTRSTSEETLVVLQAKMERMKRFIDDVNRQLESFADFQGVDVDMMLGKPAFRHSEEKAHLENPSVPRLQKKASILGRTIDEAEVGASMESEMVLESIDREGAAQAPGPLVQEGGGKGKMSRVWGMFGKARRENTREPQDGISMRVLSEASRPSDTPLLDVNGDSSRTVVDLTASVDGEEIKCRDSEACTSSLACDVVPVQLPNITASPYERGIVQSATQIDIGSGGDAAQPVFTPAIWPTSDVSASSSSSQKLDPAGQRRSGVLVPNLARSTSLNSQSDAPEMDPKLCLEQVARKKLARQKLTAELYGVSTSMMKDIDEMGEEILGGELVVHVVAAKGLACNMIPTKARKRGVRTFIRRQGNFTGFKSILASDMEVFCALKCEGTEKRTARVPIGFKATWDEEVTFKSVPVSAHLMVVLYGKSMLGMDTFLGEVVIPLREVEDTMKAGDSDVRAYTLGRRNVRERVSGEIYLSIGWRITPLDRVTLKVRALEDDLKDRQELLAMLTQRYVRAGDSLASDVAGDSQSEVSLPTLKANGLLEVKVVEAKNLVLPHDRLMSFYTMDAYAVVICQREAGSFSKLTKIQRNRINPRWNQEFSFDDVGLSSNIVVQVFDRRRVGADDFLGQVSIPVQNLKDGNPHYAWMELQRHPNLKFSRVGGQILLRLKWGTGDSDEGDSGVGILVNLSLKGIGISLVEASHITLPRELMHLVLDTVDVEYRRVGHNESGRLVVRAIQMDNQLLTSNHPVVFAHSVRPQQVPGSSDGASSSPRPVLEVALEKINQNPGLQHFQYFNFLLQEMDLILEENFLDLMLKWFEDMSQEYASQHSGGHSRGDHRRTSSSLAAQPEVHAILEEVMKPCDMGPVDATQRKGDRWYFEVLKIQPIKVNVTLLPTPGFKNNPEASRRYSTAKALGLNLFDFHNVPLRINAMMLRNAFMRPSELVNQIARHVTLQVLKDVHKILGSVDILGTPIKLGSSLITGVASFFYEPAKGIVHSPEAFTRGLAAGTMSLIKNSMYGVFDTVSHVTGGVSKGLAALSLDDVYYQRFQSRHGTNRENVIQGFHTLGWGIVNGVTGIVMDPVVGAAEGGVKGFAKGVCTGVVGIVTKPTSGMLECFAKAAHGIGGGIKTLGDEVEHVQLTRIRHPRSFGANLGPQAGSDVENKWRKLTAKLAGGKYHDDIVMDYIIQATNALIITDRNLIYCNFVKERQKWALLLSTVTSVSVFAHDVLIHFSYELQIRGRRVKIPSRKRVVCPTRDLRSSMLVKVNHAIRKDRDGGRSPQGESEMGGEREEAASDDGVSSFSPDKDLRLMNAAPPQPLDDDGNWHITDGPGGGAVQEARRYARSGVNKRDPQDASASNQGFGSELGVNTPPLTPAPQPKAPHRGPVASVGDWTKLRAHDRTVSCPDTIPTGGYHPAGPPVAARAPLEPSLAGGEGVEHQGGIRGDVRPPPLDQPHGLAEGTGREMLQKVATLDRSISTMTALAATVAPGHSGPGPDASSTTLCTMLQVCAGCLAMDVLEAPEFMQIRNLLVSVRQLCSRPVPDPGGDAGPTLQAVELLCRMAGELVRGMEFESG